MTNLRCAALCRRSCAFLAALALLVAVLPSAVRPARAADAPRPNIVLIFADDLGINDLSCYGRKDQRTPNLDRLASQGIRFTCAYTAQPICSPSRAALMTGKSPARLHLTNYLPGRPDAPSQKLKQPRIEGQLPLEETTIAEVLKRHGYATGLFGKWHLGGAGFGPNDQGFDETVSPPANTKPSDVEGGKGEYAITRAAIDFIERHKHEPFFCYVPHNNPHIPLGAKPGLVEKHKAAFHPVYAAMIETLDDTIGLILRRLDELELAEKTIVIFTSDNGGLHVLESGGTPATHNTPWRAGKGFLYEGGLREPLIVRWPGRIAPGSTSDVPVVLSDLVPTLLACCGLDSAKEIGPLDGRSILPLLTGGTIPARPLYWHFPNYTNQGSRPAGALREGNWKLVEHFEDGQVELFDLATDPGETRDVAARDPKLTADLLAKLRAWRTQVGAQMPEPKSEFDSAAHRRLYVEQDPSMLLVSPEATAAAIEPVWKEWRATMNSVLRGRRPQITPAKGDVRLLADKARVHGTKLRYEPQPNKNVLGFWTQPDDWADWEFEVPTAGTYEVEVLQGCGNGSGGARVAVEVAGTTLEFVVQETGHFQSLIQRTIGTVELPAGKAVLAVKPKSKPGPAVMDLRRVVLRPVAP